MNDIAAYFNNLEGGAAHFSWAYWAWNANSGDTGGIVSDNWADIIFEKVGLCCRRPRRFASARYPEPPCK